MGDMGHRKKTSANPPTTALGTNLQNGKEYLEYSNAA